MRVSLFALFALMALATPAFALTIDHTSGMNDDGTAKFADPDEQRPGFMNNQAAQNDEDSPLTPKLHPPGGTSMQMPFGSDGHAGISVIHPGMTQQQDAFDRAYSHFGN